ncbi:peptidylprolyl isomerase [Protaetiibacter mangrovi]|uniref:peptidylprolyl isomerase n=1 Tax=Protaetiibacter mangrovi TaxID=2970926 RepID=A0ABT1ZBV4_9MICO|nr:peptidylprolyl isomerase [Protaetiibacter mangrovi]MCS0498178.1 peptidylprolyl isomerase [Protaetiibacter mangrovi]TPW92615.1 peptidylprolyl isomerase [Schumannella luteola]
MASSRQQREQREARERLRAYQARQEVHEVRGRRRRRDNVLGIVGGVIVAALAVTTQIVYFTAGPGAPTPEPSASATADAGQNVGAPDSSLAEGRTWTGEIVLNETVTLGISLDGLAAPQAVSGWIQDVQDGYYDGKTCHRLATADTFSFLQCGSLDGTGAGDPDFSYGPIENAPPDDIYPAGTIAMARASGDAYSNGHQFFIVTGDTTLPSDAAGGYTVVGTVTSGLDQLIRDITSAGVDQATLGSDGTGSPAVPTTITSVTLQ